MPQHITVILANNQTTHFHGDAMYDGDEGILVIDTMEGATINFVINEGYVVSWVTSPMDDDETAALEAALRQAKEAKGGEDDGHAGLLGTG